MSAIPADLRVESPWRSALPPFLLLLAAIVALHWPTAVEIVGIWERSETFAHCFLVVPIVLWLVWRQRARLAAVAPKPEPWAWLALAGAAALWLAAELVVVNAAEHFAFAAMLVLAVPAVLGREVTKVILFPLLFVFFGVPFGEFMLPVMMEATADFTVAALQLSGVPVFREGQNFLIPSGSWSVIDECSGVRYLMASFMVGSLFAYLNYRSYRRRAVFMAVSIAVPIVANWLRAYIIVMMAHLSGNKLAVGVDHILYGWVFFGVIVFIMFMVGARWSQPDDDAPAPPPARGPGQVSWLRALPALLIVALPHLALAGLQRVEAAAKPASLALPAALAPGWGSDGATLKPLKPEFGKPSAESERAYAGPPGQVGVYMAYFRGQGEDRKIVSAQHVLVGMRDPHWAAPLPGPMRTVQVGDYALALRTTVISARASYTAATEPPLVAWRLYWIDGRFVGGDARAKIAAALSRLRGHGDEGAEIVLYAQAETADRSHALLETFVRANSDRLGALLAAVHAAR